jgi:adenylate cyclase
MNTEQFEKIRAPLIGLILGVAASLIIIGLRSAGYLQFVELANYDIYLRMKEQVNIADPRIVLIQTVEEDIQKLAEWPISDQNMFNMFDKLLIHNPRAIGVDLYRDIPIPPGTDNLNELLVSEKRIIIIEKFGEDSSKRVAGPEILRGTEQIGFSDVTVDNDGVVRRGLLFLDDGENFSVSFALRLSLLYLAKEGISPQPGEPNPEHIRLGNVTIPPFSQNDGAYTDVDDRGYQYLLDFMGGKDRFKTYSLSDVLEEKVDPALIKDSVVIVGVNAESVKDEFLTPYDRFADAGNVTAGIAVHGYEVSQLLRAALEGDTPMQTMSDFYEHLWIFIWGMLAAIMCLIARTIMRLSLFSVAGLSLLAGTTLLAFFNNWWLPILPPAFAWVLSAGLVNAFLSGHEKQEKKFLMDLFSSFMDGGRLEAQTMTITVLFLDLANFTTISEKLTPQDLLDWLNEYMETMASLVNDHGGVVDNYIGDAIKADFGIPIPRTTAEEISQDAINASNCALAMRREMEKLNIEWSTKTKKSLVKMRVGIATGSVVAGCLGSSQRIKYTTIGDVINTAARLESYGKEVPEHVLDPYCQITISAATTEHLGDNYDIESVGSHKLKGKTQSVEVYALKSAK